MKRLMLLFISQDVPEIYDNVMKIFEELDLKSVSYKGMVSIPNTYMMAEQPHALETLAGRYNIWLWNKKGGGWTP